MEPRLCLVTASCPLITHTARLSESDVFFFTHLTLGGHKSSHFSGALPEEGGHVAIATHETAAAALRAARCQRSSGCGLGTCWFPDEIISLRHSQRNKWYARALGRVMPFHGSLHTNSLSLPSSVQTGGGACPSDGRHLHPLNPLLSQDFACRYPLPTCPLWLIPWLRMSAHTGTRVHTHTLSEPCSDLHEKGGAKDRRPHPDTRF